jgi:cytochrome P450
VHISDPDFYTTIYAGHRDKDPSHFARLSLTTSSLATIEHHLHTSRRRPISNYFSKQSIENMEPLITSKVQKLSTRLQEAHTSGLIVPLDAAFYALTADIISEYCYGLRVNYLDDKGFNNDLHKATKSLSKLSHIMHFIPCDFLIKSIPDWVLSLISPSMKAVLDAKESVRAKSKSILCNQKTQNLDKRTIFYALNEPGLPPQQRSLEHLVDQGSQLMGAGVETTGSTLKFIMFHLLHNKSLLVALRNELMEESQSTRWSDLEKLPYLV